MWGRIGYHSNMNVGVGGQLQNEKNLVLNRAYLNGHKFCSVGPIMLISDFLKA